MDFGTPPTLPLPMELRKQVFRKLKNEFSIFKSRKRDLTIGDVAHAQQNENKLSLPSLNRNIVARKQLQCKYECLIFNLIMLWKT